jgi:ketosteroid isomerase-like protein
MSSFAEGVTAGDMEAVAALLADDVVFRSPVAHKPYVGKPITAAILAAVFHVFEDFHYVREIRDSETGDEALVFSARVDGLEITGCDFLQFDADGKIAELMVMVRPLRAAEALAQRMGERFEAIKAQAAGRSE